MEEESENGNRVTQDNEQISSLVAKPYWNQGDAVKKLASAFRKVFKDVRSGYHLFGPPLIHTGFTHKHLIDQIS
jgi:hypothetical protein